jgi:hypothetical protein
VADIGKFSENRQNFRCQFFLDFFVLLRFQVLLSDGSSNTLQKTFYKKIVSKGFYKKIGQKSKTDFFSIFSHVFWAFLGEGSKKTRPNISQKKLTSPGTFLASEEPTNHPKVRQFVFEGPLLKLKRGIKQVNCSAI